MDVEQSAIVLAALEMLAAPRTRPLAFDDRAPFGAGDASKRIVAVLKRHAMAKLRAAQEAA